MKALATLLIAAASAAHAQFAVMHTNGVVTSPTNLTIEQGNVAGLTQALDGKLATNGSAAALTNFPSNLLSHGTNGQVAYSNTNPLTFTNPLLLSGGATNNQPQLLWETDDGIGNGGLFVQGRRFATNLWAGVNQSNWSILYVGQNINTNFGAGMVSKNTNLGANVLVMENMYNYDGNTNDPSSEIYFETIPIGGGGQRNRPLTIRTAYTNTFVGEINLNHTTFVSPSSTTFPILTVNHTANTFSGPHFEVRNLSASNTAATSIYINQNNNVGVWLVKSSEMQLWRNLDGFRALRSSTNGVIIGANNDSVSIASRVHLGGDTRIDGAITFDNTTNAATTRTNLGLGGGITTNVSSGTLQFSNGILIGHTP
jgi:hypothetical protein